MGASLTLPWTRAMPWPGVLERCREGGFAVVALTTGPDAMPLHAAVASLRERPLVLLVGNEGCGLSDAALRLATHRLAILMAPGWDSLNAAMAAGIALYELSPR
jgi:23S rRNA (guanosine2251-2'-O)-methyltransferase